MISRPSPSRPSALSALPREAITTPWVQASEVKVLPRNAKTVTRCIERRRRCDDDGGDDAPSSFRFFSASCTAPVAPDRDKTSFSFVMVFWVGLRQGVGSASISSLVRQLYQRKRCSELSGTVGVARQRDRITFDPRVLGSAFPKSFPCLSARAWSQAGTVQLDGCTPYPPCEFPLPPVWNWYTVCCTSCCFSQTLSATHRLLETAVPHVVFHKPRCATLRLFPHVDVNRDQLLHVFLRAVFPGPCFCELSKVRLGMETVLVVPPAPL